jgi:hypothetical protein
MENRPYHPGVIDGADDARNNRAMTVTITEEQREAAHNLRESMRIFNQAIREAAYRGLHVEVKLLQLHRSEGPTPVPQVDVLAKL